MKKLYKNNEIAYYLIKKGKIFYDILTSLSGSVHVLYTYENEQEAIKAFKDLTNRDYTIGCVPATKTSPSYGIIVLQ